MTITRGRPASALDNRAETAQAEDEAGAPEQQAREEDSLEYERAPARGPHILFKYARTSAVV